MLNRKEREIVRNIVISQHSCWEREGVAITFDGRPFIVPTLDQVKEDIIEEILYRGFNKVERIKPTEADAIIRVYQKLHYKHHNGLVYNLYGGHCFTPKNGKWVTLEDIPLDYSSCKIRHWICQDDYIDFECDFFDVYVVID